MRWDDFVRNENIRARQEEPPVSLKLRSARMKWLGHIERMGEERQVKRNCKADMEGRTLVDVLRRDLERSGQSLGETALDRGRWRTIVRPHATTTPREAKSKIKSSKSNQNA